MQIFGFFLQNLSFDGSEIRLFNVLFEILADLTVFVHELKPYLFSEHIAADVSFALVDKESFLVVCAVIPTNNYLIFKPENKLLQPIDLEPDINLSLRHKKDFLDFLEFCENYFVLLYETWLQVGEDFHHKLSVVLV